jgi:hypothetical protein
VVVSILTAEDGGDVLSAHTMQMNVDLLRAFDDGALQLRELLRGRHRNGDAGTRCGPQSAAVGATVT